MEISRDIPKEDMAKGVYIELDCCMCGDETTFGASTKEELQEILKEEGWSELESDEYGLIGHWCGCDYRNY